MREDRGGCEEASRMQVNGDSNANDPFVSLFVSNDLTLRDTTRRFSWGDLVVHVESRSGLRFWVM